MQKLWVPLAASLALALTAGAVLLAMGRNAICTCGDVKLFVAATDSADTSQHLADWYTPTHVMHGLLFYFVLWLVARRLPVRWRFVIAVAIESAWEVFENSDIVINRYRQAALSHDYVGDSVLNSMSDITAMAVGFLLAAVLPAWAGFVLFVAIELLLAYAIRDGLILNIIMLIHPFEAIENWQQAGVIVPAVWPALFAGSG